jgi:hypothetical protein
MDILAAVPEEWKSILGSKLTIKPVRTASGACRAFRPTRASLGPRLRLLTSATPTVTITLVHTSGVSVPLPDRLRGAHPTDVPRFPLVPCRSPSSPSCVSRTGVRTSP